jgi:GDP-L-fucose synthase
VGDSEVSDAKSTTIVAMHSFDKVLVTGGNALVGMALRSIQHEYPNTEFVFVGRDDCDLINRDATMDLVGRHRPRAIVHLAAVSGGVGLSTSRPALVLNSNVQMTLNVLDCAREFDVTKTVMTLSSGMYPAGIDRPMRESDIHTGLPHESNYSYAFAKRLIEVAIRANRQEFGLGVVGVIPNGIYGPHDKFAFEEAAMLPSLIRRFYEGRQGDKKLEVWGDGSPLREYTFSPDIARAVMWCLEHYDGELPLNIGSVEEHSVRDIALMVATELGIREGRIEFDPTKPSGVHRKSTDNSVFVQSSGFSYTPFSEGLHATVKWFIETSKDCPALLKLRPTHTGD